MKKIIPHLLVAAVCFLNPGARAADLQDYLKEVQIHGFVSQGYMQSDRNDYFFADTEDGTFQFNETAVNFSVTPVDNLRIGVQFLSRDLGQFGDNDIEVDWAFGDYRLRDWLGLRAGKLKLAQGLYNQSRDIDAARPGIFLPTSIYNEAYRETQKSVTGAGLYGIFPFGLEYQIQLGKMDIDNEGAIATMFTTNLPFTADSIAIATNDDTVTVHLEWRTPLEGLRLAGTYTDNLSWETDSPVGVFDTDVDLWVFGAEYIFENLTVALEYKEVGNTISAGNQLIQDVRDQGYYGMVAYRFTDWFEAGGYYAEFYENKDDRDGDAFEKQGLPEELGWLKDAAVFTRFDINDYWMFKLEGHYFDGLSRVVSAPEGDPSKNGYLFAAKTTFSF